MKNWIGGVTVPLSSLISRGLVEGELHLKVPPLMFNYAKESEITPTMDVYISIDANSPTSHDDQQVFFVNAIIQKYYSKLNVILRYTN